MLFFDPVLPPRVGQHGPLPSRVLFRRGKMSGVLEESCPHLCGAASSIPFASLPIPRADKMDSPSPHWALRMPLWGCALQDRPAPACGSEHSQLKLTQATLFTKLNIYSRFPSWLHLACSSSQLHGDIRNTTVQTVQHQWYKLPHMYHLFIRINTANSPLVCMVSRDPCAYLRVRSEVARPVTVSHIRKGAFVWVKSGRVAGCLLQASPYRSHRPHPSKCSLLFRMRKCEKKGEYHFYKYEIFGEEG